LPGQIIVVSGTSGAGKSTVCELLARRSEDFYLLFGIDHFLSYSYPAKFSQHGPRSREGIYAHPVNENDPDGPLRWSFGEKGWQAFHTMHEWVAAASRQGCNIVLDHLMMSDPPVLQDCIWRLKDLPVLFVSLKPPYAVLQQRIASRKMDKKIPAVDSPDDDPVRRIVEKLNRLRPWFYESNYANDCYDLTIDTERLGPEAVCEIIERRVAEGPGTAFETLRARWPMPERHSP
jgi:chloramphenicol 3-O-phosphotransferase